MAWIGAIGFLSVSVSVALAFWVAETLRLLPFSDNSLAWILSAALLFFLGAGVQLIRLRSSGRTLLTVVLGPYLLLCIVGLIIRTLRQLPNLTVIPVGLGVVVLALLWSVPSRRVFAQDPSGNAFRMVRAHHAERRLILRIVALAVPTWSLLVFMLLSLHSQFSTIIEGRFTEMKMPAPGDGRAP